MPPPFRWCDPQDRGEPEEIARAVEKTLRDEGVRAAMAQARDAFVLGYASERDGLVSTHVAQLIREVVGEAPA